MGRQIVLGLLGLCLAGCIVVGPTSNTHTVLTPKYISTGSASKNGNGLHIAVRISDDRPQPVFVRRNPGAGPTGRGGFSLKDQAGGFGSFYYELSRPAPEIVKDSFEQALRRRDYVISESPTMRLDIGLRTFLIDLDWYYSMSGLGWSHVRGHAEVEFLLEAEGPDNLLFARDISQVGPAREQPGVDFGDKFLANLGEPMLSEQLSQAIDKVLDDPEFLAIVARARDSQSTGIAKAEGNVKAEGVEPPSVQRPSNPVVWTPDERRCLWVLAVGVGQYKDVQVPPLPFARSDAERVREWFLKVGAKGMTRDNIHVLFDEQATRENLLGQIDWLRKQALPEDAVFVYFAGHGAPELAPDGASVDAKYLVLHDSDPSQLFSSGFPLEDLTRKLDMVKAKTQVVVLEACYAGSVGQEILKKTPTADLEIRPRSIQTLGEKGGRVILSASSGRQIAIGSDEIGGSLFTHYLLDSWGDGSRGLLYEQYEEARYQVRRASNRLGSLQEPAKFGDSNIDIVLKPQ